MKERTTRITTRTGKALRKGSRTGLARRSSAAPGTPKPAPVRSGKGTAKNSVSAPRPAQAAKKRGACDERDLREVFWQNVLREMLSSLIILSLRATARASKAGESDQAPPDERVLDGRLGLMTAQGERVPIARIYPVFSASVRQPRGALELSRLLECTVFQVHTPGGEVYTLPIQEIRGFHSVTEEVMQQLESNAREGEGDSQTSPFGFAAFTSLARGEDDEDHGVGDVDVAAD